MNICLSPSQNLNKPKKQLKNFYSSLNLKKAKKITQKP